MIELLKNWKQVLIGENSSVRDAINSLNASGARIVIVCNKDLVLKGTISDGDIRRAILNSVNLDETVKSILNIKCIAVNIDYSFNKVINLFANHKIEHIPIIDSARKLNGVYVLKSIYTPETLTNTMLVMAGGKGQRLYPETKLIPKPMVKINGIPMLEIILMRARSFGIRNFIISVHHLSDIIMDYFKDGQSLGVNISYIVEKEPLGTAGSLSLVNSNTEDPIIVSNADVLSDIDYSALMKFHIENNAKITVATKPYEWQNPFGVLQTEASKVTKYEEKPILRMNINAGVYVFNPKILKEIPIGIEINMNTYLNSMINKKVDVFAYPIHERWIDIGRPDELEYVRTKFRDFNGGQLEDY
jgi:dTDP-glucose pyrophosphorylase/sulfur carrier protein ThiS